MTTQPEEFSLGRPMPQPTFPAAGPAPDVQAIVFREIQMMQAAGWRLEQHWPGGADFVSNSGDSGGISIGVHAILMVLTLGVWLLVWIPMELFGKGGVVKRTRLIIDEYGQPQYGEVPKR